jgi:hypothetical protein
MIARRNRFERSEKWEFVLASLAAFDVAQAAPSSVEGLRTFDVKPFAWLASRSSRTESQA